MDYVLEIGRVVRYDVNDSLDDVPATKRSEGIARPLSYINSR